MSLGTFVAGRYSGARGGSDLGITEQGWEVGWQTAFEDVQESDKFGAMLIESVYRGVTNVSVTLVALEYLASVMGAAWPGTLGQPGVIGRLATAMAASLVLTATANTPAAASPATLTAARTLVLPQSVRMAMNSKLRKIPFGMRVYLNDAGDAYFTTT